MHQTIKALSWAIIVLWIVALLIPITIGLSLLRFLEEPNAIGFGETIESFSAGTFNLTGHFYIKNPGFYDISDMNVTVVAEAKNATMSKCSTFLPSIPAGETVNSSYSIDFSLSETISKNAELLFNDTNLNLGISTSFRAADVIGVGISTNTTTFWGAPFHSLTVSGFDFDLPSGNLSWLVSFDNHARFPVDGTVSIEIRNDMGESIGSSERHIYAPSGASFSERFSAKMDYREITSIVIVHIHYEDMPIFEEQLSIGE